MQMSKTCAASLDIQAHCNVFNAIQGGKLYYGFSSYGLEKLKTPICLGENVQLFFNFLFEKFELIMFT